MTRLKVWKTAGLLVLAGAILAGCTTPPPPLKPGPTVKVDISPEQKLINMGFQNTHKNKLYNAQSLNGFFKKIDDRANRKVRIVQIGDSHIRGHVLPAVLRQKLSSVWGSEAMVDKKINYHTSALAEETESNGFVFHGMGKNGVTIAYYLNQNKLDEIARLKPDLIIISVGTNESHAKFVPDTYSAKLDTFMAEMKKRMAEQGIDVAFLLTTPPCSHIVKTDVSEYEDEEGKLHTQTVKTKVPNPVAADVSNFQFNYAVKHRLAVWNLYDVVGGKNNACANWMNASLMAKDGVHYTNRGYTIQAELLGQAILDAYRNYRRTRR